ncbi:MAG TPA: metal-dependent transcriptional regulator [Gaiellales bacterium]|nr:metal-dependent transcriptional regulator [Gaiellales bacterium]
MVSESAQDYLKAIWKLERSGGMSTSALAESLGVAPASATAMLKKLATLGLVVHERYRGATLTPAGERMALEVVRHHRLLELYLMEALGLSWDQVHEEAEKLEHHLSDELEARIDQALGFPTRDPHGDPIPSPELLLARDEITCLSELAEGSLTVVRRVPDGDPELLRYLASLGLVPAEEVTVVEQAPFDGPVTVEVRGSRHAIGRSLAARIEVGVERAAAG